MVNRRVFHQGLTFLAGNVQITTHGSVGIDDESLAIMAEVPMQDSWIGGNPALKNQTLQIPIEGTLKNPKIDRRAIEQFAGQMIQNTARGALLDQVNKQLNKLLPVQR
jgi:hypothetical protein